MKGRRPGRTDRPELNPGRGDNDEGSACQLVMFWNTVAGFGTPFALPKENCSEKYKPQINNYHAER